MRLDPAEVLAGYRQGIFPMAYSNWPFFTWHDPPRRAVLPLNAFHTSRSLTRFARLRSSFACSTRYSR